MKAHQAVGAAVVKRYSLVPNLERVKLPQGTSVKDAVMSLYGQSRCRIRRAELYADKLSAIPNDTLLRTAVVAE